MAWDHSVDHYRDEILSLTDGITQLQYEYVVRRCAGSDPKGTIGAKVVEDIDDSQYLLAFLERPNCHVLFEAGYALGRGKGVFLTVYAPEYKSTWVEDVP